MPWIAAMPKLEDTDSWDYPLLSSGEWDKPRWTPSRVDIEAAGLSDPGKVRANNEDHFLITRFGRFLEQMQSNLPPGNRSPRHELIGHALLVADGLGGHAAGEAASQAAIQILMRLVADTPDWIFRLDEQHLAAEVQRRAALRIEQISRAMTEQADADPSLRGFGTTLTLAWGLGQRWFVAHVGDSRAYRFRLGVLLQLTDDHTVAQELADTGVIEQEQVAGHRLRNRLTRLLGDDMQNVTPQIRPFGVEDRDTLMLCSDGLTDMLSPETIAGILAHKQPADACCRELIDAALEAGGKDNITAIVARIGMSPARA